VSYSSASNILKRRLALEKASVQFKPGMLSVNGSQKSVAFPHLASQSGNVLRPTSSCARDTVTGRVEEFYNIGRVPIFALLTIDLHDRFEKERIRLKGALEPGHVSISTAQLHDRLVIFSKVESI
jgi:hypothetical protein